MFLLLIIVLITYVYITYYYIYIIIIDQQVGLILVRDIQYSYRDFAKDLLKSCDQNEKLADIPIQFKDPIYGTQEPSFTDFVAPGVILT